MLACVNPDCKCYQQTGQDNLIIRKTYGQDCIRYLRCRVCGDEFSERKNTALWNTKVSEARAESVAEHLAEGTSQSATARLAKVACSVVKRLQGCLGKHGQSFHDSHVQAIETQALQADERHGFYHDKGTTQWEAELFDPRTKLVLTHVQGERTSDLIAKLLHDGAQRLTNRHALLLLTDGEASYASVFPEVFGTPYQPPRNGTRGRLPKTQYRIPRTLAHVQIVKHRVGRRVVKVDIRQAHGSRKFAAQMLRQLGYTSFNTSAIERYNGTARRMSAYQVRKSLAFARRADSKPSLRWWALTVYNWCRAHRSLRSPLPIPQGRKHYAKRSPAMAAGLATHIFSIRALLLTQVFPIPPRR